MKLLNLAKIIFTVLFLGASIAQASDKLLVLEGDIPGQYVSGTSKSKYAHGAIVMYPKDYSDKALRGLIKDIITDQAEIDTLAKSSDVTFVQLKQGSEWDVIYPGLIDLHNHTKQNNLGVWDLAHGQFANRFEWRGWGNYTKSVSGNMNPWIGFGKAITCAAFRWSEIQAMVAGTTFLQGPSSCVTDFAIHQVENKKSYPHSDLGNVQAPTDLVLPNEMVYIWDELKADIEKYQKSPKSSDEYKYAYELALANNINKVCDTSKMGKGGKFTIQGVREKGDDPKTGGLDLLTDQNLLKKVCTKTHPKFVRYVYFVHKSVNGKRKYAETLYSKSNTTGKGSAIIAHLAEGRRDDKYNQREFEIAKLIGMDKPHVNFVHAVGLDSKDFKHMANNQMGIIWSPFSNMLLYNQTLDIADAIAQGVMISIGSDWLPTGSKGPLEELKIAADYVDKAKLKSKLSKMSGASSSDEALYKMATENAAKMINHWQTGSDDPDWENGEDKGGIGTLSKNAMGTLIVASKLHDNPFTNLVRHVWETDINLVVVDGKIQYGNVSYLDIAKLDYETIPNVANKGKNGESNMATLRNHVSDSEVLLLRTASPSATEKKNFLEELASIVADNSSDIRSTVKCDFSDEKGFVLQNTKDGSLLSNVNLDSFKDIQRLIGINMMTQSRNRNNKSKGDVNFQVENFTPLYTCDDENHYKRVSEFISKTWPADTKNRASRISDEGHGKLPARMAENYK